MLHYQPVVSLADEDEPVKRCEFLLRMRNPDGTLVPPGAFIPAAERYNLIAEIDRSRGRFRRTPT